METTEQVFFKNEFGKITDKRIVLNYKSGVEDIPISVISSISLQHRRNYFFALGSFIISGFLAIALFTPDSSKNNAFWFILLLLMLLLLLSGIANWIGHHVIIVSSAGQNRKPLKVEFSKTREGKQFVEAVRKTVFK